MSKYKTVILIDEHTSGGLFKSLKTDALNCKFQFKSRVNLGSYHVPRVNHDEIPPIELNPLSVIKILEDRIKLRSLLALSKNIKTPKSLKLSDVTADRSIDITKVIDYLDLPIVSKSAVIHNKIHQLIDSLETLAEYHRDNVIAKSNVEQIILESFFRHDEDYRIFASPLLGEDRLAVILALRRVEASRMKLIDPVPKGAKTLYEVFQPNSDIIDLALNALKAANVDLGYTDIMANTSSGTNLVSRVGVNPERTIVRSNPEMLTNSLISAIPKAVYQKYLNGRNRS